MGFRQELEAYRFLLIQQIKVKTPVLGFFNITLFFLKLTLFLSFS